MPTLYAENALAAKIHSLYGKRLTQENYTQLLQKKTVGEVTAYLKQETAYSSCLGEVKEDLIVRGQLENLLRKRSVDIHLKLTRYSHKNDIYSVLFAFKKEIEQLLLALQMLGAGSMGKYIVSFPAYLDRYLSLDLFALAKIQDYDQLLDVLRHSRYYQILGPFRPVSSGQGIDIPGCEAALLTCYYQQAIHLAQQLYHGETRKSLLHLFGMQIDLHNIMMIYRLKRYFKMHADEVGQKLIRVKGYIPHRIIDSLLAAETDHEAVDIFLKIVGACSHWDDAPQDMRLEWSLEWMRQSTCQKIFRYSSQPMVILFSYMGLLEIELRNIVNIIEGIRYGVTASEIRKLLIL